MPSFDLGTFGFGSFDTATVTTPVAGTDVPDHVAAALGRLLEQDKNKTNISNWVTAFVAPIQALESALWQLLTQRRINTAIGAQLDALGKLVGQGRNGAGDSDYARFINARIRTNVSRGRIEDLIAIARLVLNDALDVIAIAAYGTAAVSVRVTGDVVPDSTAAILISFLRDAHAAGVKLTLESLPALAPVCFATAMRTFVNGATLVGITSLPVVNTDNFPASGTIAIDQGGGSYPTTAGNTATAVGYGTWNSGYLFDDASGNAVAAYGGVNLTPLGTVNYANIGALPDTDKAFAIDTTNSGFSRAGVAVSTGDLGVVAVVKLSAYGALSTVRITASNTFGGGDPGWDMIGSSGGAFVFTAYGSGGALGSVSIPAANFPQDEWVVLMCAVDRGTGKMRVGLRSLWSGVAYASAEATVSAGSMTSAGNTYFGGYASGGGCSLTIAAGYLAFGAGNASGLSANLLTALSNFHASIMPNLEIVPYLAKGATSFQLLTPLAKTHADRAICQLTTQTGRGWGDSQDVAQPALTRYAPAGIIGGQLIDARE